MNKFWRLSYIAAMILVACTSPGYPGIDRPNYGGGDSNDRSIIDYIDQRLEEEYYWLDEVAEKSNRFNRNLEWESYLDNSLRMLTTNADDGYYNSKGQRMFYSYIRETSSTTRSEVTGFGIGLHYTIAVIDPANNHYGFVVEMVYPDSPAAKLGVVRGDVITMFDNSYITPDNYYARFTAIENNSGVELRLTLRRQSSDETYSVTLPKGAYSQTPVPHSEVIEVEETKIGYLVYTGFESEYDDELLAAIAKIAAEGAEEFILDLRCNGGGSVASAVKLCSALVPKSYDQRVLCHIERNEKNKKMEQTSLFSLENTGEILSLGRIAVICSGYSASASELVVMGLRGLDFPVRLIGSTTEGKNCGMDVTRRTIGNTTLEYAPITFMCFNDKGFGDWGEGITPDIDLTSESNGTGVSDANYPLPRADWGDVQHDIALAVAIADITGKSISQTRTRTTKCAPRYSDVKMIPKAAEGIRIYHQE